MCPANIYKDRQTDIQRAIWCTYVDSSSVSCKYPQGVSQVSDPQPGRAVVGTGGKVNIHRTAGGREGGERREEEGRMGGGREGEGRGGRKRV